MIPQSTNRFAVASPDELMTALAKAGYTVRLQGDRVDTSTSLCHGGDSDNKLGLFFDPDKRKWSGHCLTGNCDGQTILHRVQAAAGLQLCRCQDCFDNWRQDGPRQASASTPMHNSAERVDMPKTTQKGTQGRTGGDTAAYAARLWEQAAVSTGKAPPEHPVSRWLAGKAEGGLWPPSEPLPWSVRWLAQRFLPVGEATAADSPAAGALVVAMRPLTNPWAAVRKVQLVAIDADGAKARHWLDGDKRTYGSDSSAVGLLAGDPAWPHDPRPLTLHVCEGLADGLRILRYAGDGELVAVCAGTGGYSALEGWHQWFARAVLWPDGDPAGLEAAQTAGQHWADLGLEVTIQRLASGQDPASAPLTRRKESA